MQIEESEMVLTGVKACVFDAYGTLFDVHSAIGQYSNRLGDKAQATSMLWRDKQLQYTWLRAVQGAHVDFWQVTADGLDFALEANQIDDSALRDDLLNAYLSLSCYPEVPDTLARLNTMGLRCAILSNGSPKMLEAAVGNAAIGEHLEALYSVESVGVFKPSHKVYQLVPDDMDIAPSEVCFLSSNAWDATAAAHFGFQVVWINRFGQAPERLPGKPKAEIITLDQLPPLLTTV